MTNIPNMLTILRLCMLPVMVALFYVPFEWAAWTCLTLFVIGAATDWLDGWIARRYHQVSEFGTLMDPISDKIFVITILLMLVAVEKITGPWVLGVVIIIVREFLVSGLREYFGPRNIKFPVSPLAKWKTAVQMIATCILIVAPYIWFGQIVGNLLLTAASALTIITGWAYLKAGLDYMKKTP